eukprot:TRINITY_DN5854_c1_g1_i1.p1 TRINITY_DN5854_c1_g1~~TRINITY_DN5854_c1_g1_i1.p1  ORF type:complete len:678 (-),score=56.42 TRINITY_DN5854_c1_g1_i1:74-2107(-)
MPRFESHDPCEASGPKRRRMDSPEGDLVDQEHNGTYSHEQRCSGHLAVDSISLEVNRIHDDCTLDAESLSPFRRMSKRIQSVKADKEQHASELKARVLGGNPLSGLKRKQRVPEPELENSPDRDMSTSPLSQSPKSHPVSPRFEYEHVPKVNANSSSQPPSLPGIKEDDDDGSKYATTRYAPLSSPLSNSSLPSSSQAVDSSQQQTISSSQSLAVDNDSEAFHSQSQEPDEPQTPSLPASSVNVSINLSDAGHVRLNFTRKVKPNTDLHAFMTESQQVQFPFSSSPTNSLNGEAATAGRRGGAGLSERRLQRQTRASERANPTNRRKRKVPLPVTIVADGSQWHEPGRSSIGRLPQAVKASRLSWDSSLNGRGGKQRKVNRQLSPEEWPDEIEDDNEEARGCVNRQVENPSAATLAGSSLLSRPSALLSHTFDETRESDQLGTERSLEPHEMTPDQLLHLDLDDTQRPSHSNHDRGAGKRGMTSGLDRLGCGRRSKGANLIKANGIEEAEANAGRKRSHQEGDGPRIGEESDGSGSEDGRLRRKWKPLKDFECATNVGSQSERTTRSAQGYLERAGNTQPTSLHGRGAQEVGVSGSGLSVGEGREPRVRHRETSSDLRARCTSCRKSPRGSRNLQRGQTDNKDSDSDSEHGLRQGGQCKGHSGIHISSPMIDLSDGD